ncbi:MAG TPA: methyltransferase domain-containing protein [Tepidisphaeraceae bacterium]|jgi:SAM-dependent methyltransferase
MLVTHEKIDLGDYSHLRIDRSGYQQAFWERLLAEPGAAGRVLNVGCGPRPQPGEVELQRRAAQFDGVDPSPVVLDYPGLAQRWQGTLECAPVPENAYDLAWAYNVVEHVERARPFFEKVKVLLKRGGVFWALTPHGHHPFCNAVKLLQVLRLKQRIAERDEGINKIPSYYRLNTSSQIQRAIGDLGFASARFYYLPCMQWNRAFPRALRFAPRTYDYLLGARIKRFMLLLAYRLEAAD